MTRRHTAIACGKVLLFGEHAVVHGQPAIALGLPDGARATAQTLARGVPSRLRAPQWDVEVQAHDEDVALGRALGALLDAIDVIDDADETLPVDVELALALPPGVGLGSSAALGMAAAKAIAAARDLELDELELIRLGYAWEGVFHGTPSGIDHTAAACGGIFVFERGEGNEPPRIDAIELARPLPLVVAVAGPASSTREMVAAVTHAVENEPSARRAVERIGRIVRTAARLLANEDASLDGVGRLMDVNHALLDVLGLTTPALESACEAARDAGALGAKITGAGGGGCIVALCAPESQASVAAALEPSCSEVVCRTIGT